MDDEEGHAQTHCTSLQAARAHTHWSDTHVKDTNAAEAQCISLPKIS